MRHVFRPDADEISVSITPTTVQIRLDNQAGDTFTIELDEQTLHPVIHHLLEGAWRMEIGSAALHCCHRARQQEILF